MYGLPQVSMMMALGLFVFGLDTVPYQQFQQQISWRHPAANRVGRRAARQFVGPGEDTITLSGVLYPELTGGTITLAALKSMADQGMAWPLIEGTGNFYGLYVVEDLSTTRSFFFPDGSARKIEFSLKLTRTDDEPDLMGTVTEALLSFL